jgi:hypothetical protein
VEAPPARTDLVAGRRTTSPSAIQMMHDKVTSGRVIGLLGRLGIECCWNNSSVRIEGSKVTTNAAF